MTIKRFFAVPEHPTFASSALLGLRLVAGVAFMMHGWSKIQHPFDWMGPNASTPGIFQALAALSEFGGGLAWILGLLTPLASLGVASTMAVAFWKHAVTRGDPFVSPKGGPTYELALLYFAIAMLLFTAGPGRFSLDRKLFAQK